MSKRSKPLGRRSLAAPFVLTLVSCGGSDGGGPTEPTSTPTDVVNPPPVLTAPSAAPTDAPTATPTTTASTTATTTTRTRAEPPIIDDEVHRTKSAM